MKAISAFGFAMATLAGVVAIIPVAPASAQARSGPAFDIPAGPLGEALTGLARAARIVVSFDPALVRGRATAGVHGIVSVNAALDALLAGSGLSAAANGRGGFLIRAAAPSRRPARFPRPLTRDRAARPDVPPDNGSEIVVTGTPYRGEVSSGGARIDARVKDLPISISVLTQAVIEDRQLRNIRELADNVAGVQSRSSGEQAFETDFTIRGFAGYGNGDAVNGYRVYAYGVGRDPATVERVEFLKGPASVLYGASGALSGLVNIVTKTPRHDDFLEVNLAGGQYGYGRASIDANAALTGTLDVRVIASTTIEKSLGAFTDIEGQGAAASLRWRPTPSIAILGEGGYFRSVEPSRSADNRPLATDLLDLPVRFKLGDIDDRSEAKNYQARLDATWQIAPGLELRQGVYRQWQKQDELAVDTSVLIAPRLLQRAVYGFNADTKVLATQSEVRWTFRTGPFAHKLLAGYEHTDSRPIRDFSDAIDADGNLIALPPLDIDHPVYGTQLPVALNHYPALGKTVVDAGYVQDFIELGAQWKLLAGLRYDRVRSQYFQCDTGSADCDPLTEGVANPKAKPSALSPRIGLVWRPRPATTLYASWSKSFSPNLDTTRFGTLLPPERGIQYEAGLRQDLLDRDRLAFSLAAYHLVRKNVSVADPVDENYSIAIGEQKSRGIEAELSGKPLPWIDLIATYSYIDAKVTVSGVPEIRVGQRLPEAPRNSASLFTKIGLLPLGLPATAVSLGIYYLSPRAAGYLSAPDPTFTGLPSNFRIDLGAYQDIGPKLRIQLNIVNLLDRATYEPTNASFRRTTPFRATVGARIRL